MDDNEIINQLFERKETAIEQINLKYRSYLTVIADHILHDPQDCEEALNDTYLAVWNAVPPERPAVLLAYLSKIIRRASIDVLRKKNSKKRVPKHLQTCFEELEECVCPDNRRGEPAAEAERKELSKCINDFLRGQSEEKRMIFMLRYYYSFDIKEIAEKSGYSEAKIKNILFRQRKNLRAYLEKEGVWE